LVADYPGPILDRLGNGEGAKALFPLRSQYSAFRAPIQGFGRGLGSADGRPTASSQFCSALMPCERQTLLGGSFTLRRKGKVTLAW
jgi:hypothetical protein